ncbi:hypothetical protein BZA77DRAFT_323936 [Pyronema omphalodes]|nr:hypothetical protein BZA77DRAFT_323936 [Pyronema omphalodes]
MDDDTKERRNDGMKFCNFWRHVFWRSSKTAKQGKKSGFLGMKISFFSVFLCFLFLFFFLGGFLFLLLFLFFSVAFFYCFFI